MTTLGWTCHTRAAPSSDMFNLGSSYFHVALTTVRHLLTVSWEIKKAVTDRNYFLAQFQQFGSVLVTVKWKNVKHIWIVHFKKTCCISQGTALTFFTWGGQLCNFLMSQFCWSPYTKWLLKLDDFPRSYSTYANSGQEGGISETQCMFIIGTCEASRFERSDSIVMGQFKNFRIGRVCPLLVVVRRLKPLTALSGTVYRLASAMSDHTAVLFNVSEPLRIGMRNL